MPSVCSAARILAHTLLTMRPAERRALPKLDAVLLGLAVFREHGVASAESVADVSVSGSADRVLVQFVPALPGGVVAALNEAGWRTDGNVADEHPTNTWWHG